MNNKIFLRICYTFTLLSLCGAAMKCVKQHTKDSCVRVLKVTND